MQPFVDSSDLLDDGPALRERMERDGYLFLSGLLPAALLEDLRRRFLVVAQQAGWVDAEAPLEEALADLAGFCVEPQPEYMEVYHRMYCMADFHRLQHHPRLVGLVEALVGGPVLPHPRLIGRLIFPQREAYTTPPHQDYIPIQGTAQTYTAWFPLADLPSDMGGLEVAAGSHRGGVYKFKPALGAGGLAVVDDFGGAWAGSPFKQGDVLFFHSMAVHRGRPNVGRRLRLSVDARYQSVDEPIAPGSLQPHSQPHTWEEIYRGWPADAPQYYWRDLDLQIKEYDGRYHEERDRQALELAAQGDPTARSALQRIIARDGDAAKRDQAARLLAALDAGAA